MKKRRAIFLDRDGTVCEEANYLSRPEDLRLYGFAAEAIKLFSENDFLVVLITNQSGVARGFFDEETLRNIHEKLTKELNEKGARLDAIYFCPHVAEDNCRCRKPQTGMIEQAAREHSIDMKNSWMIGDKAIDWRTGTNAGAKTCLVLTGYGRAEVGLLKNNPDLIAENLLEAAEAITNYE